MSIYNSEDTEYGDYSENNETVEEYMSHIETLFLLNKVSYYVNDFNNTNYGIDCNNNVIKDICRLFNNSDDLDDNSYNIKLLKILSRVKYNKNDYDLCELVVYFKNEIEDVYFEIQKKVLAIIFPSIIIELFKDIIIDYNTIFDFIKLITVCKKHNILTDVILKKYFSDLKLIEFNELNEKNNELKTQAKLLYNKDILSEEERFYKTYIYYLTHMQKLKKYVIQIL